MESPNKTISEMSESPPRGVKPHSANRIIELVRWELETTYRAPILEILLGLSVLLVFISPPIYLQSLYRQSLTSGLAFLGSSLDLWQFLFFVAYSIPLAASLGSIFETGEIRFQLSNPVRRLEMIIVKVGVNLLVLSLLICAPVILRVALEIPMSFLFYSEAWMTFLLLILLLVLRVLLICAVTTFFAILFKNGKTAIFCTFSFLFLLMLFSSLLPIPITYLLNSGQVGIVLLSFITWLWAETPPTVFEFPGPLLFITIFSISLLIIASLYFQIMDVK